MAGENLRPLPTDGQGKICSKGSAANQYVVVEVVE